MLQAIKSLLLSASLLQLIYADIQIPCVTPYGDEGICIEVKDCNNLANYMKTSHNSEISAEFLRQSKCQPPRSKVPHICCPLQVREIENKQSENKTEEIVSYLLPVSPSCGELFQDRIINGIRADLYDYPWLALLKYESDNTTEFKCGGVLINDRYVLTAAQCASNTLKAVRLGEHDLTTGVDCDTVAGQTECNDGPQDILIDEFIAHEDGDVDLALIRLKRIVIPSEFIHPICLPMKRNNPMTNLNNTRMTISGWNQTKSSVRLHNTVVVLDNKDCKEKIKINLDSRRMCAERRNKVDFCSNESGGPLVFNNNSVWTVYGIYSFGLNECTWPIVYTNVHEYIDWILKTVRK